MLSKLHTNLIRHVLQSLIVCEQGLRFVAILRDYLHCELSTHVQSMNNSDATLSALSEWTSQMIFSKNAVWNALCVELAIIKKLEQ